MTSMIKGVNGVPILDQLFRCVYVTPAVLTKAAYECDVCLTFALL
jgi:hypothetical protein